jgi:hypothetical protein
MSAPSLKRVTFFHRQPVMIFGVPAQPKELEFSLDDLVEDAPFAAATLLSVAGNTEQAKAIFEKIGTVEAENPTIEEEKIIKFSDAIKCYYGIMPSKKKLAEKLGVPFSTFKGWIKGDSEPPYSKACAILSILNRLQKEGEPQ